MPPIMSDLRYTARSLRRSPASSLAAVFTLALVAGADAAIFSVVDAALLRPLPFANAESMVQIGEIPLDNSSSTVRALSYPTLEAWQSRSRHVLAALEPYDGTNVTVSIAGAARRNARPDRMAVVARSICDRGARYRSRTVARRVADANGRDTRGAPTWRRDRR